MAHVPIKTIGFRCRIPQRDTDAGRLIPLLTGWNNVALLPGWTVSVENETGAFPTIGLSIRNKTLLTRQ
ncbi:MAG: hypothetical protein IPK11_15530 [Ignavibacteria bacterium]|nr:hypothetical protein [Ignavibacteria bacterium]